MSEERVGDFESRDSEAARACVMARRPHIARGRSGTCASEAACAMAGRAVPACRARAFLCPSVRAWRMARREGREIHHTTRVRACLRTCVREFRPGRPRLV